jgi:uncharacterized membrane protein
MFTSIDKALAAMIGSVLFLINMLFGINVFGEHNADVIEVIIAVLVPLIVWLVPNRE